jgi:hypothetical protein
MRRNSEPGDCRRFIIERITDHRISELNDPLPWNITKQIAKTKHYAAATCLQLARKDGGDRTATGKLRRNWLKGSFGDAQFVTQNE